MKKDVCIGIDQSYTDTGIAIVCDGKVKYVTNVPFSSVETKSQKREVLREELGRMLDRLSDRYNVSVVIEAVRLFSGESPHISTAYIFGACAMVGSIVEICSKYSVPVSWVETRSWKSQILGSSKPSGRALSGVKDKQKVDSVLYAIRLGFEDKISSVVKSGRNKGKIRYNDNMADAICIAICGYRKKKLKNIANF